jgi:FkbM family methyltransferase
LRISEQTKTLIRSVVPRAARNWLRSPSKSAEWLWNRALFSLGVTRTAPLLSDWGLLCHPHVYRIVVRDQIEDPEQSAEFRNFVSHCSRAMFLFDVGAHFGVFSLTAAHFGGRAVAVDPSPTATRMIACQAALNGLADRIQILRAALSDAAGTLALLSSGVFSDGYFQVAKGRPRRELTEFPAITVDQMTAELGMPTHVKIDVEGHEGAVIRGARHTLAEHSPVLFLEIHNEMIRSGGGDPSSLLDELDRLGYATFSVAGESIDRPSILARPIVRIVARRPA